MYNGICKWDRHCVNNKLNKVCVLFLSHKKWTFLVDIWQFSPGTKYSSPCNIWCSEYHPDKCTIEYNCILLGPANPESVD